MMPYPEHPSDPLDRSRLVLRDIHRRWDVDGDPLRPVEEQDPQRTPTEKAEIDLAIATALVSIAQSLREREHERARERLREDRGRWRG